MTFNLYVVNVHIIKYKRTRWGKWNRFTCHFPIRSGALFAHFITIAYWEFMINFVARPILLKSITLNENDHHKEIKALQVPQLKLQVTELIYQSMSSKSALGGDGWQRFEANIKEQKSKLNKYYWWEL